MIVNHSCVQLIACDNVTTQDTAKSSVNRARQKLQMIRTYEVFVEAVEYEHSVARVGPAAMHQQQATQEAKLGNGEIRAVDGLATLLGTKIK